jgi:hypothetical protein
MISHSRSHDAVIRVYDEAGNGIETNKQAGEFRERSSFARIASRFPLKMNSYDSAFVGFVPTAKLNPD